MPRVETTTPTSDAELARARRNTIERRLEEFEPELTAAEIEAQGLTVSVSASGITFYIEPAVCAACAAGDHEQPRAIGEACACACHGQAPARRLPGMDYTRLGWPTKEAA